MGHMVEHVPPQDVGVLIREVERATAGPVGIVCALPGTDPDGARRWPGDEHRWEPAPADLRPYGFRLADPGEWPVAVPVPWQYCVSAH